MKNIIFSVPPEKISTQCKSARESEIHISSTKKELFLGVKVPMPLDKNPLRIIKIPCPSSKQPNGHKMAPVTALRTRLSKCSCSAVILKELAK